MKKDPLKIRKESKTVFLTSSPYTEDGERFIDNDFLTELRKVWVKTNVLNIASFPDSYEISDEYSKRHERLFREAGFEIDKWIDLDHRNHAKTAELIKSCGVVILNGGHCMTEMNFFNEINLKNLLNDFEGIIIGVSAGSMNAAATVYAPEEYEEELEDPNFKKYYQGLGLTDVNIFPHYQMYKNQYLRDKRMMEDIVYKDSVGHKFLLIPDGSYLLIKDGKTEIHGEHYFLKDGVMHLI